VLIVVIAIVVIGVFVFAGRRAQTRRLEGKREEAQELRSGASDQARRAQEREELAEEQAERARRERQEAEERLRRADEVDPDTET
jgi:flagellar biosynthesis/type III secretory pathway M-ring protein FliF/YscJ